MSMTCALAEADQSVTPSVEEFVLSLRVLLSKEVSVEIHIYNPPLKPEEAKHMFEDAHPAKLC